MTDIAHCLQLIGRLDLPSAELSTLSFCNSSRSAAVAAWTKKLPVTQINSTAALLYQAVREITKLNTTALNHLEILESVRPYVQQNIQSLSQQFLGQPLILPENAMKTAIIAQALQRHISVSYCLVVRELLALRPKGNFKSSEKKALGLALHRAVTGIGLQFMRSAQIYTQAPPKMWLELNTLYQIAQQLGTLNTPFPDPLLQHRPANTLEQAFMRIALLACARPNQLSQQEVKTVYDLLDNWSRLTRLSAPEQSFSNAELYFIGLDDNSPPAYKSNADAIPAGARELLLSPLANAINKQREHTGNSGDILDIPSNLPDHLINHLLKCWSEQLTRISPRRPNRSILKVAVGLSSIHYNLLGQMPFQEFMQSAGRTDHFSSKDVTSSGGGDPWDSAFDSEGLRRSNFELGLSLNLKEKAAQADSKSAAKTTLHPLYQVQVLDSSSEGYRLDWRGDIPPQTKAGELISLYQSEQSCHIGVIRWAKQHKHGAQFGVQIIASEVKPCAAQQLLKMGDNNVYMHALLAPAGATSKHGYSRIITAIHPFRAKQKVNIREGHKTYSAMLTSLELSTSCISLFNFRPQETAASTSAKNTAEVPANDFQSNW